ncbi:uncharacterized protein DS421_4g120440 [Arachis hypogaea]|nr:uncharacterized protein DS421_4g120440 [Arachis hypogaea]
MERPRREQGKALLQGKRSSKERSVHCFHKQTSSMKELLSQMLSAKEEVEEQKSEEDNQEKSHSIEAKKCVEEGFIEQLIQKAFDEDKTPTITQPPSLDIQEVKATNKSTNPIPDPVSKLNQATYKRKVTEERPRQRTIAESSPLLKSFLLTNWKKRKKVKNMSTVEHFMKSLEIMKTLKKQLQVKARKKKGKNEKAKGSEYQ